MDDTDLQKISEDLRTKAAQRKQSEKLETTKERMTRVLSKRDLAIRRVEQYQDKTGIPSDNEVDQEFFGGIGVDAQEVKKVEKETKEEV